MKDKNQFLELAESLKLVRKTRIEDYVEDKTIDDIYTDLLPKNGIINKLNLPRTTILVGRKGTGKSTIFQKSQKDRPKIKTGPRSWNRLPKTRSTQFVPIGWRSPADEDGAVF